MSEKASNLLARMQCRNSRDQDEVLKEMERLIYMFFPPLKIKEFKPIFYSFVNESLSYKNPHEDLQPDYPKVIVVDSRQAFHEHEFYSFYPEHKNNRSILSIYRPTYEGSLVAHTHGIIKQNLTRNINLKLVLVFAPPSRIFRNAAQKFDLILHRTPIMCKIIFVWDSPDRTQILSGNRRDISQSYFVETEVAFDEFEANYDVTFTGTKNRTDPKIHRFRFTFNKTDS